MGPGPEAQAGAPVYMYPNSMRGEAKTVLGALGALLAALPALALDGKIETVAVPQQASEIHAEVGDFKDAVASPFQPHEKVSRKAYELFNEGVPGSRIAVKVNLRGWDTERGIDGTPADVDRIVRSGQRRLMEIRAVPAPEFSEANSYATSMNTPEKMDFAKDLDENMMGMYRYSATSSALGTIKLNQALRLIAAKVGDVFAFATVVHEAAHARDHQKGKLSPDKVVDGEVLAFQTQYLWLKMVDPYGERLALIRAVLAEELKTKYSRVAEEALKYATALHVLAGTLGEERKIREYIEQLGYQEGQKHRHDDGHDHPSA